MREPFAQIALIDLRSIGELGAAHRTLRVKRPVQPERVAHAHQGDTGGAAQIAENLSDELIELSLVDHEIVPSDQWTDRDGAANHHFAPILTRRQRI